MAKLLERLQLYGYSDDQEVTVLSALLTGEPLLLIGDIGSAKTTLIRKLGRALEATKGYPFTIYNTAMDNFEDIIGLIDIAKMKEGKSGYIATPATIWDKMLVGLDEVNRPKQSTASKWLDYMQDRSMMGLSTAGRFLFGAMNPLSVQGTNPMGEATLGRFASFVWVTELSGMSQAERAAILRCTTESTLPGMGAWNERRGHKTELDYKAFGITLQQILEQAADHYLMLLERSKPIEGFLNSFIAGVQQATKDSDDPVRIDGRRGGMLFRHILAYRAVHLARANVLGYPIQPLAHSVRAAVRSGLPIGVNSETGRDRATATKIDDLVVQLIPFLEEDAEHRSLEIYTELMMGRDPFRMLEILLTHPIHEVVKSTVWNTFAKMRHFNGFLVGYLCLQIEAHRPGTIPESAIDDLAKLMDGGSPIPEEYSLTPDLEPYRADIQVLLEQSTLWEKLLAGYVVGEFLDKLRSRPDEATIKAGLKEAQEQLTRLKDRTQKITHLMDRVAEVKDADDPDGDDETDREQDTPSRRVVAERVV